VKTPWWALMGVIAVLSGCIGSDRDGGLLVLAASSLQPAMDEIVASYEATTGQQVSVSYAGSQALAAQVEQGFEVDIFISANQQQLTRLRDKELLGSEKAVASNQLALLIRAGNPRDITGIKSLESPDLIVVLADPSVPLGRYTDQLLTDRGISTQPASLEASAASVATKVRLGEADLAVGYVTARGSGLEAIPLPGPTATYTAAVIIPTPEASTLIEFMTGTTSREIFARHGFGAP
jgi:molybdate transport system substrate-binding protein